jgi:hypothetical protein
LGVGVFRGAEEVDENDRLITAYRKVNFLEADFLLGGEINDSDFSGERAEDQDLVQALHSGDTVRDIDFDERLLDLLAYFGWFIGETVEALELGDFVLANLRIW